jgi:membrane-associated phospholipid phosphatase
MRFAIEVHRGVRRGVDRVLFGGRPPAWSPKVAFILENLVLMLGVFYLLLNTLAYNWTGSLYAPGTGFRLDAVFGGLDNRIPFVPEMAIFYVYLFYSGTTVSMLYFAFVDAEKGYALGWALVVINLVAVVVYAVFPVSTYWYRAELLAHPRPGFWAGVMYRVYASDTPFNCFPSLHAAVSAAMACTWYRYARERRSTLRTAVAAVAAVIAAGVIISTLFVRQHYIADEIAGAALGILCTKLAIDALWTMPALTPP